MASDTLYAIEFNHSISLLTYCHFISTALRLLDLDDDEELFLTVSRSLPNKSRIKKPTGRID